MHALKAIPGNDHLSDEELINAYRADHDQSHLAALYLRYTDLVYGVALKYLENTESAKDAVMNIYQELVRKLQQHEVENFRSWLYVLTKHHCLMQLRKEKKTKLVELTPELMQSEDYSHLDTVLQRERTFRILAKCIEKLQEEQQTVIRHFYLEGKCYNEIVTLTGQDWAKVRSQIQNGRRNLKICMDKNG